MSQLPVWVQYLQALSTPIIAAGVAYIAYRQWQVANAKLMLDLFERRMAVYNLAKEAVRHVNTHGKTSQEADAKLLEAIAGSEFLFGQEVTEYLEKLWHRFIHLSAAGHMLQSGEKAHRQAAAKKSTDLFQEITAFYTDAPKVFGPYMRMDHRVR